MQNSYILVKKTSNEVATLFSFLKLCYKGIPQKDEFGRLLPLFLAGIAKQLEISPSKHESSFMEINRASNFD